MADKPKWKDVTIYAQDDYQRVPRNQRVPRSWELRIPNVHLRVTRTVYLGPDTWRISMEGFFARPVEGDRSAEYAKSECLHRAKTALLQACQALAQVED